jgi:hypothetical protein
MKDLFNSFKFFFALVSQLFLLALKSVAVGINQYELNLNSSGISAETYVLKLQSGNKEKQIKLILIK